MKDALLLELARRWEAEADSPSGPLKLTAAERVQLRACADTLRMLVDAQKLVDAVTVTPGPAASVALLEGRLTSLRGEHALLQGALAQAKVAVAEGKVVIDLQAKEIAMLKARAVDDVRTAYESGLNDVLRNGLDWARGYFGGKPLPADQR